ncbi:PD-(D/E)XK nuclease family protein [Patescibacteria group bacterium]|nr:PD-(D/E)XK nuclease family protein [Patescibacteria group bacterium]
MYKLSPSDFAYLYQDCKHCYYQKIKNGITLPSMPMPGVFSAINSRLQGNMVGKSLKSLFRDLPDLEIIRQEGWVDSLPIPNTNVFIKGKYDLLAKKDDGSHVLIDLKISQPGEDKVDKYKTQLAAYKFALENPKLGKPMKTEKLALLIFYPDKTDYETGIANVTFPHTWMDIPVDEKGFHNFMKEVDTLLSGECPEENPNCLWCKYRLCFQPKDHSIEDLPF